MAQVTLSHRRAHAATRAKPAAPRAQAPVARPAPRARPPTAPAPVVQPPRARTPFTPRPTPRPGEIPTRFLREFGTRAVLRLYWGEKDCPNSYGRGAAGIHNAKVFLMDSNVLHDHKLGGEPPEYGAERWPAKCDHCPAVPPPIGATGPCACGCGAIRELVTRQVFTSALYHAPDGTVVEYHDMEPGDMYLESWRHDGGKCHYWDNCTSPHLTVILPDGFPWDTSSRASNCTMKEDRTHRCWVVHGDPSRGEIVTVDKAGATCAAGGGSILSRGYHGMLQGGVLRGC